MEAILKPISEAGSALEKFASRDLTPRMPGDYLGEFAKIKSSVNQAAENLDNGFQQVAVGAEQVASASNQIANGSQALAQGSSE
jgi:methyl-accepting chemotaxis protein